MYSVDVDIKVILGDFIIEERVFRYSSFMGRLYNLCKSLGFERNKILPSRAFCSDESQGYPVILIAKHFGSFPFNHGREGGVVSTMRHGPYAEHGEDLVIIQASHVGYDPDTHKFGTYLRMQTQNRQFGSNCGLIASLLEWYLAEYEFARQNILLERQGVDFVVIIDNQLLRENRPEGIFLNMDKMAASRADGTLRPIKSQSTSKCYIASNELRAAIGNSWPEHGVRPIGASLVSDLFRFKRSIPEDPETDGHLEQNVLGPMTHIVTSPYPSLLAALVNTQMEFDRTYRTLLKARVFQAKQILFISGLNIDISPKEGQLFPLTKFAPWACFVQKRNGEHFVMEHKEIYERLLEQSDVNPEQVNLEHAIHDMADMAEIKLKIQR